MTQGNNALVLSAVPLHLLPRSVSSHLPTAYTQETELPHCQNLNSLYVFLSSVFESDKTQNQ